MSRWPPLRVAHSAWGTIQDEFLIYEEWVDRHAVLRWREPVAFGDPLDRDWMHLPAVVGQQQTPQGGLLGFGHLGVDRQRFLCEDLRAQACLRCQRVQVLGGSDLKVLS
jgi:hypothetical protein